MARIKNSLAKAKDIRVGKTYWTFSYKGDSEFCVVRVNIKAKHIRRGYVYYSAWGQYYFGNLLFPGDLGVVGHAYDKRPNQLFNNKRSAQFWLDHYVQRMNQEGKRHFNFFVRGIHN